MAPPKSLCARWWVSAFTVGAMGTWHLQLLTSDNTETYLCSQFPLLIFWPWTLPIIYYLGHWDWDFVGIISSGIYHRIIRWKPCWDKLVVARKLHHLDEGNTDIHSKYRMIFHDNLYSVWLVLFYDLDLLVDWPGAMDQCYWMIDCWVIQQQKKK